MKKAVFGLVNNEVQAQRIVDRLISSGFVNEDISILYPDKKNFERKEMFVERDVLPGERRDIVREEFREPVVAHKHGGLTTEAHTKTPEGGATGALTGGILGGSLGLLAGIGALAIPGLGPFIAAGPLMATLSGSAIGGALGLLIGAIVGYGIPEYEAKKYESGLKQGNILISVHTENEKDLHKAYEIFKAEKAFDISSTREIAQSNY